LVWAEGGVLGGYGSGSTLPLVQAGVQLWSSVVAEKGVLLINWQVQVCACALVGV
jgi:hypothetical protein